MKTCLSICFLLLFLTACSRSFDGDYNLSLLYKIDIQQGNVIEQKMLNKLRPGLDKGRVRFILGTPTIVDPFHTERWEYIYSFQKGGGVREQRHITLHFEDDKLSYITGNIIPGPKFSSGSDIVTGDSTVIVPEPNNKKKGFFKRLWENITPEN